MTVVYSFSCYKVCYNKTALNKNIYISKDYNGKLNSKTNF